MDSVAAARIAKQQHIDSIRTRFPRITYTRHPLRNAEDLAAFRAEHSRAGKTNTAYRVLTTLHRKEIYFFRVGDTVLIPDRYEKDLRAYSVFPQYWPEADTIPKIVVISNTWQSYACYAYGELVRFAAANTGEQRKPTFPGRYQVGWKQRLRLSSLDSTWRLPFTVNFHQYAGNAFHQFEMPGRPVSHSCVRQFIEDAEWLFKWVKQSKYDSTHRPIPGTGTPVLIIDLFDYKRRRGGPWLELASNQDVTIEMPKKPLEIEEAMIPISQIPKDVRGALPNRKRYLIADSVLRTKGIIADHVKLSESIDYNKLRREKKKRKAQQQLQQAPSTPPQTPP
jgi:lipoprotein-anchoring transpeptidase ErfK/SrfK